LRLKG